MNCSGFLWKATAQSINLKVLQIDGVMQISVEIRKKLAMLIGHLLCGCIRKARMIPTVLHREEVISILVEDPALFERLVRDEQADNSELSKEDLTVKRDAVAELGKLEKLEEFEKAFWEGPEVDLSPLMALTNQLTRTFAVYLGNAATLFDRSFEEFMTKYRQSLERVGMTLRKVDFTPDEVAILESYAVSYLTAGEFLQAFTFDRLLSSQITLKQVVNLPEEGFSLRRNLIRSALNDPKLSSALARFVIRVSYISQGVWEDLFPILSTLVHQESVLFTPAQLVDLIEQDVFFSCNLLCRSYAEIRQWQPVQRRVAIESSLKSYRSETSAG
jgi:hypothetical protein